MLSAVSDEPSRDSLPDDLDDSQGGMEEPLRLGELYTDLARKLDAERRARGWLRSRPTSQRLALAALAVGLTALAGAAAPRPNLAELPLTFWLLVAGALGVAAAVTVRLVLRPTHEGEATPLERHGTALAALLVPIALAVAVSKPEAEASYGLGCLLTGLAFALPTYVLVRHLDRQPETRGHRWLAAGVAGLAAYGALTLRCPGEHLTHLVVGHAGAGVLVALASLALARLWPRGA